MENVVNIKNHPWFATMDWNKLINKEIHSPFVPKIENDLDTQNFDREFTECSIESEMSSLGDGKKLEGFSFERSPQEMIGEDSLENNVEIKMEI